MENQESCDMMGASVHELLPKMVLCNGVVFFYDDQPVDLGNHFMMNHSCFMMINHSCFSMMVDHFFH